jgi:hypothetical protein
MEVALGKTNLPKKENGRISSIAFEVTIPANTPDNFTLVFQNYYVYMIIITQDSSPGQHKTILDGMRLMNSSSNEAESQLWHTIPGQILSRNGLIKGKPMKIQLIQTIDIWNKIDIKNLKVVYSKIDSTKSGEYVTKQSDVFFFSQMIPNDFRTLSEAAKVQSSMKGTNEIFTGYSEDTKRSQKRKDRKRRSMLEAANT